MAASPGSEHVRIRELVAWGLDESLYRPEIADDSLAGTGIGTFAQEEILLTAVPESLSFLLNAQLDRSDLQAEMRGLDWTVGMVDLRGLLAFQRRLVFDDQHPQPPTPAQDDWPALFALTFGPPIHVTYRILACNGSELLVESENPNLQLRPSPDETDRPFHLYGGSPFFEVASYRGRWFLRDGYHRAYCLLRAGLVHVPAVVVRAKTLAELGPVQPWFFLEETLFSAAPPRVIDFLNDDLTLEYTRPRLRKRLRVTITESLEPARTAGEQR